jgi:uncharacterized protein (TIGR03790 family)
MYALKRKALLSALVVLTCSGGACLRAANPGDEVIIVYNTRMPGSKDVADYYAERRLVPTNQIFGFALSTNEDISRVEFRDALQKPLAQTLANKKLWQIGPAIVHATTNQPGRVDWKVAQSKIRYAVLCYGVPLRINPDPNFREEGMENLRPEMRRDEAAVDSELTLLPLIEQKLPLAGPLRNPVYTSTNTAMLHPTNGVLLVARLDGPTAAIARGGQGAPGRSGRPVGPRLLRPAEHHRAGLQDGRRLDSRRVGHLPAHGL